MSELLERIKKNSTIKETSVLAKSIFFTEKDMIPTKIPILNIALSGSLDGGLTPGLTMFAGPSKNFKTMCCLVIAQAYLQKYSDAVLLFLDSEFGASLKYFESLDIDTSRVIHTPLTDIEQLKFELMKQLEGINRGDHLIIVVDSIGNLASKQEIDNALAEKSTVDMTRARNLKSLFRMITPHLNLKDIPMIVVNHTYKSLELFSKDIVGGGVGSYLSSDSIFIMGRQQEKDGTDLSGFNFIINVEKSRYVREKSKLPMTVSFEHGISKYSGLMELALDAGVCVKPNQGWYSRIDLNTGEVEPKKWRMKETHTKEFWEPILTSTRFKDWIKTNFAVGNEHLLSDTNIDQHLDTIDV